ncbi:Cytidine and deoxycytidylate deaminase domain containing protein [uncultured Caudovirales phage]|uniref:Cytidine and deoxycytidylate deaminase domain containing protein n=1 Tax=uncultured Caudovirales phage TaxID=2100421 RepID=A0A6J5KPZ7_9CAUD|nr:Cytidine and deoxycytidylate deaminase domain containing protein [uncultured Caudovirales phage]
MKLIKILEDRLLDNPTKTPEQIAQDQNVDVAQVLRALKKGITVEQEHTSDIRVAREIALDHLSERWDYYDVLAKAERNPVAEAEVPGTQMVTLDVSQLQEALTFLQELAENINDESMNYEDRPDLFKKLERDHRAITAVETVMRNNLRALKKPELLQTNIFLYDVDDSDLSYMDFVGAIHVQLHGTVAEVKWIGSYDASGRQLMQAAMKIAKQRGATSMKLDAKWESEGFYHKMGFKQSGPTVDQPLSGSQLTPFHRELDESARLLELFDPNKLPANIRIKHTDVGERYNTWKVSIDDQQYSVDVDYYNTVDEKFADGRLGIYYVYFGLETGGGVHFGITKTGKSFEIFAAVAAILYRFQKSKPSVGGFYFSAEEPSRQKLYSALSNKMAQSLGWRNDRDLVAKVFGKNSSRSMFLITTPKLSAYMHSRLDQTTPTQELDEVVMSPNALKTWVRQNANILAGVKIGFEAEMCVPDLTRSSDDDDAEHEPDYSDDEEISNYNWQSDIKRWFQEHDADGMNGRNEVRGAIDQCQSEIDDWISNQMSFSESEIKEVISSNNPDFSDEEVEESFDNQDGEYDTAVEELQQSVYENFEFSDWGRENRCRKMSDFASKYDLIWPVYHSSGGSGGGEMSYSELADSWTETSGYKSTASTGYHSAKRQPDLWIFEPDSSIKSDDSDDGGVELVSPPMPFDQGIAALAKFFQWAPSVNAYANQSCGFHIGVSLPPEIQKTIDPVKLLLFLGDEHVLAEFGRSFNTYTKSSMKSLRQRIQQWISQNYSTPQDGLAFIKSTLADPAQSVLPQMARRGDRYVSVNIKDNYIEFRSAGGDYFEKQQEIFNTVMRYVRAMTIASDPQAEKQEYLKKLYKLLAGSIQQPDNPMGAFMRYSAGQITRDELLKIIQQKAPSNQPPGAATALTQTAFGDFGDSWQHYEVFRARDEFKVHEFMATDDQDAQARLRRWAENNNENPRDYVVKPVIFENSPEHRDPGQPVSGSQRTPFRKKLAEKWSRKYKKGIDCAHPRGFSQRAHCAGRKKRQAHGKTSSRSVSETAQISEIHSYHKLDRILVKLCDLVDSRHAQDPEKYGLVGAALLDPKNQIATGVSTKHDGQWYHAERRAMTAYRKKYGSIPPGCIIVVTCSPCSERMDSRHGDSCTDLINSSAVKKVYCGFDDETQPENQREFNIIETADPEIRDRCRGYAEQFMDWEVEQMKENTGDGVDQTSPVTETLKKVKGRWALVSRKDPSKVLQYYHGSGHPSKEWVNKVERRVHSFSENFADHKGPGRPGDSQRHGIPKNATMAQLTKAAKSKGRKGQLARWQINMRRGQKKESLQELFDPGNLPEDIEIKQYVDNANHKKWTITRGDQTWKLRIEHSKDSNVWEAVLSSVTKKLSFDVTGEGSAPHIFGAVYAILFQEAKRDPNIKGYLFAAKEPSRRKLYRVLSRKLSQQLNWVYDPSTGSQLRNLPNDEVFAILSPETYDYVNKKLSEASQPSAQTGAALTIWDIDDTLMHTTARVFVVEPSGRRRHLSASEFNSYELRPGEKYDFAEFTDSKLFYDTSKPIEKIWRTAQNTLANIGKRPGSRMIVVTARAEFDNTSLFLKTFEKHGMDMSKVKVYTVAGASNKKPLIKRLLLKGNFTEARLFDDHPGNLRDFLSLHQDFPDIRLKAFAVGADGSVGKPVILGGK